MPQSEYLDSINTHKLFPHMCQDPLDNLQFKSNCRRHDVFVFDWFDKTESETLHFALFLPVHSRWLLSLKHNSQLT